MLTEIHSWLLLFIKAKHLYLLCCYQITLFHHSQTTPVHLHIVIICSILFTALYFGSMFSFIVHSSSSQILLCFTQTVNNYCTWLKNSSALPKNIVIYLYSNMLSSFHALFFFFYAMHFLWPKYPLILSSAVFISFFPTLSFLLSMYYSLWLSLSLCGFLVAKLELAVSVSSSVKAPIPAAPQPHGSLQVLQSSSPPMGLLAGICTRVACWSVRPKIPSNFLLFFSIFLFLQYCVFCFFLIALLW